MRRSPHPATALTTAAALALTSLTLAAPAGADEGQQPTCEPATTHTDAIAQATACGEEIEVLTERTAYATVYATPHSTFRTEYSNSPVRTNLRGRVGTHRPHRHHHR